jgi:hypothetical protein
MTYAILITLFYYIFGKLTRTPWKKNLGDSECFYKICRQRAIVQKYMYCTCGLNC